ncbi:MAG TPA: DUF6152 family protein [Steroidobacteraceae bacterium]|nr:DUF6152 family protein [Steroidobacteraceae bacterium]
MRPGNLNVSPKLAAAAALLIATPCAAHHSFSMFDTTQSVTLHGTVTALQWTNPHCYLQVLVASQSAAAQWSVEMNSPLTMYRYGWRPGSFKAGDRVTVVINPLRDGTHGGRLVAATDVGGRTLLNIKTSTPGTPQS